MNEAPFRPAPSTSPHRPPATETAYSNGLINICRSSIISGFAINDRNPMTGDLCPFQSRASFVSLINFRQKRIKKRRKMLFFLCFSSIFFQLLLLLLAFDSIDNGWHIDWAGSVSITHSGTQIRELFVRFQWKFH